MRKLALACAAAVALSAGRATPPLAAAQDIDSAFATFWKARTPQDAEAAAADIVKSGVGFDEGDRARLTRGRTYESSVPRGLVTLQRRAGGLDYTYNVEVPETCTIQRNATRCGCSCTAAWDARRTAARAD